MKAVITRSGGFAGVRVRREVDVSDADLAHLKECADGIQHVPDAFTYEVTVNGDTFAPNGERAALLLEKLLREA